MQEIDFIQLMGKGKRCWKHVKTREDLRQIKEFEELFYKSLRPPGKGVIIPEIIHFVWLGPKEYPAQSKKYLEGWIERHPGWKVFLWSDRPRKLSVEQRIVDKALLKEYSEMYEGSDNFGERSDIVRLRVLEEMGGVYIDHDMECRTSFEELHRTYPFYAGLLTPGNPVIQRSAIVRNSVIGACPSEPIVTRALKLMKARWEEIAHEYPGSDVNSVKIRVTLRSFAPFHEAVLESIEKKTFSGIVFPAGCFNEIEREFGLFAKEDMVGAWYSEEMNHHEQYLKERLHRMMKRMHLFMALSTVALVVLFIVVGGKPIRKYLAKKGRLHSSYKPMDPRHVKENKSFVVVIPSYNNEAYVERNLRSVLEQEYDNYRVIYIDDASTDGTYEQASKYNVEIVRNETNHKALYNLYHVIQGLKDEEIVVLLDGDDWLAHNQVLKELNRYYNDPNVWLTYGQYVTYPKYELGISREPLFKAYLKHANLRKVGPFSKSTDWFFSHLRTFYAGLFKKIKQDDLLYQGKFFSSAWDFAILFPMVEMAREHAVFIPNILYVYNRETPFNDDKLRAQEQFDLNLYIRSLPPYKKITDWK